MPRYIDAEQFRGKHEVAEINGKLCSVIPYADIVNAPTADVVPRAEVEGLEAELDDLKRDYIPKLKYGLERANYMGRQLENDLANAKIEVAREIFAEINAIKQEYASGDIDGNELYVRLYMLEKKYTEEKT